MGGFLLLMFFSFLEDKIQHCDELCIKGAADRFVIFLMRPVHSALIRAFNSTVVKHVK